MLNTTGNDDSFGQRLLKAQADTRRTQDTSGIPDLNQWMQYWNDADSVAGNLRRFEHWLQRARPQRS